jgi:hypothetical protein
MSDATEIDEAYACLKGAASAMSDEVRTTANETYGGLIEGVHISGYAFERAMHKLEWLLTDGRWLEVGDFGDVNAFLDSLKLDDLRMVAEQRKKIAKLIKELTAEASNRSIARALGVSHQTVYNDLGVKKLTRQRQKTQQKQRGGADKWRKCATGSMLDQTAREIAENIDRIYQENAGPDREPLIALVHAEVRRAMRAVLDQEGCHGDQAPPAEAAQ